MIADRLSNRWSSPFDQHNNNNYNYNYRPESQATQMADREKKAHH